ncbi:AAA-like domain-containing protein [Prosthecobacter debontii]|uniref:AAA-like domain-containing protein n=1 Tax=Prosthecobacter debontii TaxID=48467 RepID=A0A1T4X7P9_9BACT|nr:type IV secretion system DNA-binding domain-containing protein [Prosthecobacter debontii]SKA85680.1 AAA-like domain-containing protein [Prosthecobacter debontii]
MGWIDKALTDQFYRWELRGRGWQHYDAPVSIEPPFRPFFGHFVSQNGSPPADDGRHETIGSRFLGGVSRLLSPEPAAQASEHTTDNEPGPFYEERGEMTEAQITLPDIKGISRDTMESWFLSLSSCREPVAFELVGSAREIVAQFAAGIADAPLLTQQIAAHFPGAEVVPQNDYLHQRWREAGPQMAVVELGLSDLCMVPLALPRSDIFVSMAAAMSDLAPQELAVFQVVFEPTRHAWAESILRAVTDNTGGPFFANRPELVKQAREKIRSPLFAAVVRIAVFADDRERAHGLCLNMASCLRSFSQIGGNELIPVSDDEYPAEAHEEDILRRQSRRTGMLLNAEELTGFVHLPTSAVVSSKLRRDTGRTRPAPAHLSEQADLLLGVNQHAGQESPVWLRMDHRVRHTHIIGGSGYGKTTFLFNCIRQDIENGFGCGLLDPHGDLAERVLDFVPRDRLGDVVVVDPTDEEFSVGFNILAAHSDFEKDLIASDLVAVFRRQSSSWGEQMESVLHHAILAFLESSRGGTIADLKNFLLDAGTRNEFLKTVQDPDVVFYWKKGFPQLGGTRSIGPVVTRLEKLLSRKPVRRMVSQRVNKLDFADILDSGKIFIAKLPQGQIGAENAHLIGTLLVSKFQQMAMARQRMREEDRNPFFLYVDEAANFLTPSMAEILSGARKYRLGLILSHQGLSQLKAEPQVAGALDSSACTRIVFRVGDQDARALADGFSHFEARELQNLSVGEAVCRVERSDADFNIATLPELGRFEGTDYAGRDEAVARSRAAYGTPNSEADAAAHEAAATYADEPGVEPEHSRDDVTAPRSDEEAPDPEPPAAKVAPAVPAELGRGGEDHRNLQREFKSIAESLGFRATIEKQLPGTLECTDLLLEREGFTIAVEITVTNTLDYELRNIGKCLRAGVSQVAVVAAESGKLAKIEAAARVSFGHQHGDRLRFFLRDGFNEHLQNFVLAEPPQEPMPDKQVRHKGWTVRTTTVHISPEEAKEREAAAAKILASSSRRAKGDGEAAQ